MNFPVLNFQDFIQSDGDALTTTSQQVAAAFGKRHADVLRLIRGLAEQLPPDFNERNFASVAYLDEKGEWRVMYRITRDGFTLLAMGFTGRKALAFKVAYIAAFNAMAAYIKNQREGLQYQFLRKELEYKGRKSQVSHAAREMRHWRDEKPLRLSEMDQLLTDLQPSLLPN